MYVLTTHTRRGFTLIELLIVIAIIGIISSVVYASLKLSPQKARDTQRTTDIANLQLALRLYKDENGKYPSFEGGTVIGRGGPIDTMLAPYFSTIPRDPLQTSDGKYEYYYDSKMMCANGDTQYSVIVFASNMETPNFKNWDVTCGSPGIGNPGGNGVGGGSGYGNDNANDNSFGIILH
jgi:type II secretion system protein G